jgi:AcrR family transcriptional regulator
MNASTTSDQGGARPARGRPARTPQQAADTRARITSRALELFRSHGYEGISMRRLSAEAGCTPATLYQYFENKFDILQSLWADVLGELFDQLDAIAAAEQDPAARLLSVSETYVRFWLDRRESYYLVFMSGGITQDDVTRFMGDEALLARFAVFRRSIADVLGPQCPPEDAELRSELLVCGLNGIAQGLITISGYPWSDPSALVRALTAAASGPLPSAPPG